MIDGNVASPGRVFQWPVRVYYEDTDAGGVVYYANYLKFMERARTEWLRALGFDQDRLRRDWGVIFVVRSVEIEYLRPARFNDALQVSVSLVEMRRASFAFLQRVCRDATPLCEGRIRVACIGGESFHPCQVPDFLSRRLRDEL
jgi:acyl-CoA thioester hydrolase